MICITANDVNSLGLALDIVGVLGLFKYGLPADDFFKSALLDMSFPDDGEAKLKFRSGASLVFILAGFTVQIVSNYLPQQIGCL
jgi:hypothetical protein